MTASQIESRLSAIEREIVMLKRSQGRTPAQLLEQIHGTFENDSAFREAVRLGKKWRKAQDAQRRPKAKRK
jgi:hypothetical protein